MYGFRLRFWKIKKSQSKIKNWKSYRSIGRFRFSAHSRQTALKRFGPSGLRGSETILVLQVALPIRFPFFFRQISPSLSETAQNDLRHPEKRKISQILAKKRKKLPRAQNASDSAKIGLNEVRVGASDFSRRSSGPAMIRQPPILGVFTDSIHFSLLKIIKIKFYRPNKNSYRNAK